MGLKRENPGATALAHRVQVIELAGSSDRADFTGLALDIQVRRVLRHCSVSVPLATVIAELAFSSGDQS